MAPSDWRSRALRNRAKKWRKAHAALKRHKTELITECKVNQFGIGYKEKNKRMFFNQNTILVFVTKKLTQSQLNAEQIRPVPKHIDGFLTDIIEIPTGIRPRISDDSRYQKLQGGISMIHSKHTGSGTLGVILTRKDSSQQTHSIPSWVKNNAKWWAAGNISDNEFVLGIQHLISVGIIKINIPNVSTTQPTIIPDWVKKTTGWWGNGQIPDEDFVNAIQWLIKKGIVKIPASTKIIEGELFGLTNNHVGAKEDVAGLFPPAARQRDDWLQPGFHGNPKSPDDVIAKLDTWNKILPSGPNRFNYYDVALAKISNQRDVRPYDIKEIGMVKGFKNPEIGDRVLKRGRRTRKTTGIVSGIIPYPETITIDYHGYQCAFTDQFIVIGDPSSTPFSKPGDSGSLVVSEETDSEGAHKAKALLFAGGTSSSGIDYTFANPIKRIVDDFQLIF